MDAKAVIFHHYVVMTFPFFKEKTKVDSSKYRFKNH